MACIRRGYPNEARRVEYFRRILLGIRPSFCHHAVALLMSAGYVRPTCLTTNFDHLLEDAFTQQGIVDCQAIRSEHESHYWEDRSDRYYILKPHGDIETLNILNTREETIAIPEDVRGIVETVTRGAGLVVIGTAGNEKSVRNLFDDLGRRSERTNAALSFGLLWGRLHGSVPAGAAVPGRAAAAGGVARSRDRGEPGHRGDDRGLTERALLLLPGVERRRVHVRPCQGDERAPPDLAGGAASARVGASRISSSKRQAARRC